MRKVNLHIQGKTNITNTEGNVIYQRLYLSERDRDIERKRKKNPECILGGGGVVVNEREGCLDSFVICHTRCFQNQLLPFRKKPSSPRPVSSTWPRARAGQTLSGVAQTAWTDSKGWLVRVQVQVGVAPRKK